MAQVWEVPPWPLLGKRADGDGHCPCKLLGMCFPFFCVERPSTVALEGFRDQDLLVHPWAASTEALECARQCTALPGPGMLLSGRHWCHGPAAAHRSGV